MHLFQIKLCTNQVSLSILSEKLRDHNAKGGNKLCIETKPSLLE